MFCLQTILKLKPEGDCQVNNLRRRGQSLCDHPEADEGRKVNTQKAVRDTEEQWRTVLQAATRVEEAAGAEISQRAEKRQLEVGTDNETLLPVLRNSYSLFLVLQFFLSIVQRVVAPVSPQLSSRQHRLCGRRLDASVRAVGMTEWMRETLVGV